MNSTIFKNSIAASEEQINALESKNSELKINALRLRTNVLELKNKQSIIIQEGRVARGGACHV